MWNAAKEWLPHGAIDPKDEKLASDLSGPGAEIRVRDAKLVIESKAEMQRRGQASPAVAPVNRRSIGTAGPLSSWNSAPSGPHGQRNTAARSRSSIQGSAYGIGDKASYRTFQSFGKPGAWPVFPSQPAAIIATAESQPPFAGIYIGVCSGRRTV
jgi:hypothetical protein